MKWISWIPIFLFALDAHASSLTLQPTGYMGPRDNNPYFQSYFGATYENKGEQHFVSLHYESELIGTRHDFTLDLDRAYFRYQNFYFGRVHPWDLVGLPDRNDLWGMLAQFQPINMGIQLNPVLLAPLGMHVLFKPEKSMKLAFSASPLAVPSLGSEVSLNEYSVSTNRFGRLPPGTAVVNGVELPIRFQIDPGNILTDVLLKANLSGIFLHQVNPYYTWSLGGSYAPDPNPTSDVTQTFVRVSQENLAAVAVVHPTFPYRAQAYMTHSFFIPDSPFSLHAKYLVRDDNIQALEGMIKYQDTLYLAFAHSFPNTLYLESLFRAGGKVPLSDDFTLEADVRTQLTQIESMWINSTLRFHPTSIKFEFYVACDFFSGDTETYFGEWRTNDRVYGGVKALF